MILLAVDIGNSRVKFGRFADGILVSRISLSTDARSASQDWRAAIQDADSREPMKTDLHAICVCSSAPSRTESVVDALRTFYGMEVDILDSATKFGIKVRYDPPDSVGLDRLANVLAVRSHQPRTDAPAIVVDLGTATTFDVMDGDGAFVGGAIAPGLGPAAESLFEGASHLPRPEFAAPRSAIGRTTDASLQIGIMLGHAAMIDDMVRRIRRELAKTPSVVATGGWCRLIESVSSEIERVDADLTLNGIRLAWELNRGK